MKQLKIFPNLYQSCTGDLDKFLLLLENGVDAYEYMDSWEKFDETSVPPKEDFYSELNKERVSDADYARIQKVWEVFEIKNVGEYHNLYAQCDILLFADVFEIFRDKCDEIYGLDPANILSAPGLDGKLALKKQV